MATNYLLQRRRRDGSLVLRGQNPWDDPAFPQEYDFGFAQIGEGLYPATITGKTIVLEYANARATYHVTGALRQPNGTHGEDGYSEQPGQGFHAVLVDDSVEFFDAPEVTEEGIAAYQATLAPESDRDDAAGSTEETHARSGKAIIDVEPVEETSGGKI